MNKLLDIWTVYERPRDYPDGFIARLFQVHVGGKTVATERVFTASSLEGVRKQLPPGLVRMTRHASDEPQIVETWV